MAGRGIDRLGHARGGTIAAAVVRRAQERAALHHLARNLQRFARVEASLSRSASRILQPAATVPLHRVTRSVPVRGPLPRVADHVEEAVAVGRKRTYR